VTRGATPTVRGSARRVPAESGSALPSAPILPRLGALAYDALLFAAVIMVAGFLTTPLLPAAKDASQPLRIPDLPARTLSFAIVFAAGALYFGWSWTGGRRTLPMKTWRLAIVRVDGTALDRRTALIRYAAGWIGAASALAAYLELRGAGFGPYAVAGLCINFAWALVDSQRQFLHDRIAGTRVVVR
jgi:uncharacterized RDD family membrane protein YckC